MSTSAFERTGQYAFPQSIRLPRHCMQIVDDVVVTSVRDSRFLAGSRPVRFWIQSRLCRNATVHTCWVIRLFSERAI